ncbi:T9SS C-terminal target domain-containing protein [Mucilaginibacter terrenus]|uniref:T9SS C-terminal target domain-containing protein n=1 Tax=Mucilaginibacter terrenus TaxID=2482727 RepID=A0A3E2NJP6_9SPHI|nr:T9SS type A sorting domain-containing protein [Mucilaginibacter terrenus]RFZ81226.1 T9SS C-terminal target domain-containing protein [Mucilaginibacter terrenus]
MKKLFKSRFEIVFSLSLVAILGLPPIVLAQDTKSIEIHINNGDTTINGRDIKKLTPQERKDALGEIDKIGNITFKHSDKDGKRDIVIRRNSIIRRNGNVDDKTPRMFGNGDNATSPYTMEFYRNGDTARKAFRFKLRKLRDADSTFSFRMDDNTGNVRIDGDGPLRMDGPLRFDGGEPMRLRLRRPRAPREMNLGFDGRNAQTFNYSSIDNDGISNEVSFHVIDAPTETVKRMAGNGKATLQINDLNLSPEFSTGKTLISFSLAAKSAATVKVNDGDGNTLLSDKAVGGSFMKKVSMPHNGIYFLVVKQGGAVAVKRIVKE